MVNLEKLNKNLMLIIADVIKNEVAEAVKKEESQTIHDTIYDDFPNPIEYIRRKDSGGLSDKSNMEVSNAILTGNTVIVRIRNKTKGQSAKKVVNNLQYIVEMNAKNAEGDYYDYPNGVTKEFYLKRRPFQANTVLRLKKNKGHLYAIKKGLMTRHGIEKVTIR